MGDINDFGSRVDAINSALHCGNKVIGLAKVGDARNSGMAEPRGCGLEYLFSRE